MGRNGIVYLVNKTQDEVDVLDVNVHINLHMGDERLPISFYPSWRLVDSILANRISIDDSSQALYIREMMGAYFTM